jgi:hypothetical protein
MESLPCGAVTVCRERILNVSRRQDSTHCALANHSEVRLPLLLASHIAIGDEIAFSIPDGNAVGAEVYLSKESISSTGGHLYLATIGYATQPQEDKLNQSFLSVQVQRGTLGISWIFLPCKAVREHFYRVDNGQSGSAQRTLYQILHIGNSASLAEIRVAFKLRALELKTIGAAHTEWVKLERAFNILGHPELRAHYDSLLANAEIPAMFPYGGVGSLLVAGIVPAAARRSLPGDCWRLCQSRRIGDSTCRFGIVSSM